MSQSNDVREQILKLDSIRALKKLMIEHGINVGNRNIHIGYLVEELLSLLEQSNREAEKKAYHYILGRLEKPFTNGDKRLHEVAEIVKGELFKLQHPEGREKDE